MRPLLVLVLLAAHARADSPKLADAKQALDEVRYDDARRLLVEALDAGGNSPAAVRQIYELSASTAIVLGQRDLGEQYYRRWLALEPAAKLPAGSSPKLVEVFVAAQAHMAAHGRLAVKTERRSPATVEVIVETDPLAMAAAIGVAGTKIALASDRRAQVPATAAAMQLFVLDDRGNQLIAIDVPAATIAPPVVDPQRGLPVGLPGPRQEPPPPFTRRWTTWGVPAGLLIVAGGVLGIVAIMERDKLEEEIERSGEHFFDDVDARHQRVRKLATVGIALGAAGALLAIPAAIFYKRAQRPWNIGPVGSGMGINLRF